MHITKKLKEYQVNKIYKAHCSRNKIQSKRLHLFFCNKTRDTATTRSRYIDILNRKECSNIFNTRVRMIQIKGNNRNKYTNMTCRWCNENEETQIHILKYCTNFKQLKINREWNVLPWWQQIQKSHSQHTPKCNRDNRQGIHKVTTLNHSNQSNTSIQK